MALLVFALLFCYCCYDSLVWMCHIIGNRVYRRVCKYLFKEIASTSKYKPPRELRVEPTMPPQQEKETTDVVAKPRKRKQRVEAVFLLTPNGLIVERRGKELKKKKVVQVEEEEEEEEEEELEPFVVAGMVEGLEEESECIQVDIAESHEREGEKEEELEFASRARIADSTVEKMEEGTPSQQEQVSTPKTSKRRKMVILSGKFVLVEMILAHKTYSKNLHSKKADDEDEPKEASPNFCSREPPQAGNQVLQRIQAHSPFLNKLMSMSHDQLAQMAEEDEEYAIDRVVDCVSLLPISSSSISIYYLSLSSLFLLLSLA